MVGLFRRDQEVESTDTSVLFAFFAQWFTDSFLRTSHEKGKLGQNTSNHEIDLCQIYGLTEDKTTMLRSHVGGRLRSQRSTARSIPEFLFEPRPPGGPLVVKDEFAGLHDERFLTNVILGDVADERKDSVFAVGLEHGNSTIGNTIMNVVFVREHNRVAGVHPGGQPRLGRRATVPDGAQRDDRHAPQPGRAGVHHAHRAPRLPLAERPVHG